MTLPQTKDGCCANCGSADLLLVEDMSRYTPCEFVDGKWETGRAYDEAIDGPDTIRFFCTECGEYHEVPEELP